MHVYYKTKESEVRCRGRCSAFVFAACGVSPPPVSSKEVPVLPEVPDCAPEQFGRHVNIPASISINQSRLVRQQCKL
jgi:hypothetical protein